MDDGSAPAEIGLTVDGREVRVPDIGLSLLAALRGVLDNRAPKTGCNPQGQCGCCTVLVDGSPRVACVTPVRRVAGRSIVTVDGLDDEVRARWGDAFLSTGGSQCGACTPGIICRLEGARTKGIAGGDRDALDRALAAHLCRCTGWQPIREAYRRMVDDAVAAEATRDLDDASRRATIEGRSPQRVAADVALGGGGFAEDTAPRGALVAVPDGADGWVVAESLPAARAKAGKVQGRHGTVASEPPIAPPDGDFVLVLRTSWVEPAYLETDSSWCEPGGEPFTPLANGGAFGGKAASIVTSAARRLADEHGRVVRVVWSREDVVRNGPKRPPMAIGVRADGTGVIRIARTDGVLELLGRIAPEFEVEEVDVVGPPTSLDLRASVIAEVQVVRAAFAAWRDHVDGTPSPRAATVVSDEGAEATVEFDDGGRVRVELRCGPILDAVVLRSYAIGAVHMALGWVTSESIAVASDGGVSDLTIRSFGVLRPAEMPEVEVVLLDGEGEPVNGSDVVFAATAAAAWSALGWPSDWPVGRAVPQ